MKMSQHFIGFALYDPVAQKMLYDYQAEKYFTPASNMKLLTYYLATQILGDSLPSFRFYRAGDTLFLQPMGDPTWWDSRFSQHRATAWLRQEAGPIGIDFGQDELLPWGAGWAWEDYAYPYAAERSGMPLYGNLVRLQLRGDSVRFRPRQVAVVIDTFARQNSVRRYQRENTFVVPSSLLNKGWNIALPFITSHTLTLQCLQDSISTPFFLAESAPDSPYEQIFYGIHTDSLYQYMLQESDNFLAEQLLVVCGAMVLGKQNPEQMIRYGLDSLLQELPDPPRWVDGSGLSRYNLLSPRDMIWILDRLQDEEGYERLFQFLPAGGESGTLEKWYRPEEGQVPYVYAKTGTLSNNHNLSGYLRTDSGRILVFSLMQNHYQLSTSQIKRQSEVLLRRLKKKL